MQDIGRLDSGKRVGEIAVVIVVLLVAGGRKE